MAGHSHSKNIAIRKKAVDAKRSKLFSKMSRLIIMAARSGGGDPKTNAKLAFAISKAKAVSLPRDTIEKAIKKGTGEGDSENKYEEILYEGYGPAGVAVICEVLTENRNRTAGEVRKLFDVAGGKLGGPNCVGYMFQRRGQFILEKGLLSEDQIMEVVLDAGADDLKTEEDGYEVLCDPSSFDAVSEALARANIQPVQADIVRLADNLVPCDEEVGRKIQRLINDLDDHDDVQNVFTNADLPDSILES